MMRVCVRAATGIPQTAIGGSVGGSVGCTVVVSVGACVVHAGLAEPIIY